MVLYVRPLLPTDREALFALIDAVCAEGMMATQKFEPTPAWDDALTGAQHKKGYLLLVAEQADAIVGWCRLFPTEKHGELELGIGVDKAHRRQGIGSALMREALAWANRKNFSIVLGTHKDNLPAHKLFRNFGFEPMRQKANIVEMRLSPSKEKQ